MSYLLYDHFKDYTSYLVPTMGVFVSVMTLQGQHSRKADQQISVVMPLFIGSYYMSVN